MTTITYTDLTDTAETMADAKRAVRERAICVRESVDAAAEVVFVAADGDVYAYLDQRDADADDTGVLAFAVLTRE